MFSIIHIGSAGLHAVSHGQVILTRNLRDFTY